MVPRPEYPRPAFRRSEWVNLNGEWEFASGRTPRYERTILVPFCPESRLSGIGEPPGDTVWYRRAFDAPAAERLHLNFGAVDYRATVWVNDVEVARHEGGHTPFSADISGVVRPKDNVVVVRAEDRLGDRTVPRGKQHWKQTPEGIFYTPTTGIWQTVWLEPLPSRHIGPVHIRSDFEAGLLEVDSDADVTVKLEGEVVGTGRGRIELGHREPWHPDHPALYDLELTLGPDRVESYFGLRKVETKDGKVWLNGEPFVQRLVLDQGYWPDGLLTAPSDEALRQDVELALAFGFNGARKHQKVEDPRWLYWADRLGFLVWSEMPSFHEHTAQAERRLMKEWAEVVRLHRNHPSVVTWVPANESFGLGQIDSAVRSDFLVRLYRMTKELDPTRPVVSNDGWEQSLTDLLTLHDYSASAELARHFGSVESALASGASGHSAFDPGFVYEGQPLLVTEFGGLRLAGSQGWGYADVADTTQLLSVYGRLIDGLMESPAVQGFCYTQLTDVEQEQNGLATYDRRPKVDPALLAPMTRRPKAG